MLQLQCKAEALLMYQPAEALLMYQPTEALLMYQPARYKFSVLLPCRLLLGL
jgi:hypothetical protein